MHSKHYYDVKMWYEEGYWSINWVWNAVGRWITEDEYFEITGCKYPSKEPEVQKEENN